MCDANETWYNFQVDNSSVFLHFQRKVKSVWSCVKARSFYYLSAIFLNICFQEEEARSFHFLNFFEYKYSKIYNHNKRLIKYLHLTITLKAYEKFGP